MIVNGRTGFPRWRLLSSWFLAWPSWVQYSACLIFHGRGGVDVPSISSYIAEVVWIHSLSQGLTTCSYYAFPLPEANHSEGLLEILPAFRDLAGGCVLARAPEWAHALAEGILVPFDKVAIENLLGSHSIATQVLGSKVIQCTLSDPCLRLSEPHDICICFSDHIFSSMHFQWVVH